MGRRGSRVPALSVAVKVTHGSLQRYEQPLGPTPGPFTGRGTIVSLRPAGRILNYPCLPSISLYEAWVSVGFREAIETEGG